MINAAVRTHIDQDTVAPPLYDEETPSNITHSYGLYQHIVCGTADQAQAVHYSLFDGQARRRTYAIRVPKKREGWKAEVWAVNEKHRDEPRYEVRREALSRRYDFRPSDGVHSVMTTSNTFQTGVKSYAFEAPDGQKLVWRRRQGCTAAAMSLVSMPSDTVLAEYTSVASLDSRTLFSPRITFEHLVATLCGTLEVTILPDLGTSQIAMPLRRSSTSTSSSSSDAGPRIHRAHRQPWLGLCAPAVVASSVASPFLCAAMNRHCIMGDELSNLGKTTIKCVEQPTVALDSATAAQAAYWAEQNRAARKNVDPRARAVAMDLLIASLIAVLAA